MHHASSRAVEEGCSMLSIAKASLLFLDPFFLPSLLFYVLSAPFHSLLQIAGQCQPLPTHRFLGITYHQLPSIGQTFIPGVEEQVRRKLQKLNTASDDHTLEHASDLPWWCNCIGLFRAVPGRSTSSQGKQWTFFLNTNKNASAS